MLSQRLCSRKLRQDGDNLFQLALANSNHHLAAKDVNVAAAFLPSSVATHNEVFEVVMKLSIHTAEKLLDYAKEQSALGDQRFLLYCASDRSGAVKINLQETLDSMWKSQQLEQKVDVEHTEALSKAKLSVLVKLACQGHEPSLSDPLPTMVTFKSTSLQCDRKMGRMKEALFDNLGHQRATVTFRPRGGLWRLRDLFELLVACRQDAMLPGVTTSNCADGGLRMPRTEEGWRMMLRAGVAHKRVHYSKLTPNDHKVAASELRFSHADKMPWTPKEGLSDNNPDSWIVQMPQDAGFEANRHRHRLAEERLVTVFAHGHVQPDQIAAFCRSLAKCGHTVQQTCGFMLKSGSDIHVTGSKDFLSRHFYEKGKTGFGSSTAVHSVQDAKWSSGEPRTLLSKGTTSSTYRPSGLSAECRKRQLRQSCSETGAHAQRSLPRKALPPASKPRADSDMASMADERLPAAGTGDAADSLVAHKLLPGMSAASVCEAAAAVLGAPVLERQVESAFLRSDDGLANATAETCREQEGPLACKKRRLRKIQGLCDDD
mmetsp:Transcript_31418/g.73355  ORF Transcript_31418/g.73355 Transcript_31418/m.73355 type:complete len:545 (+) Transcript_31418:180-1814(+)